MDLIKDYAVTDEIIHAREARLRTENSIVIHMLQSTNSRIKKAMAERKSQLTVSLFDIDVEEFSAVNETFVHVLKQQGYIIEYDENTPYRIVVKW